MTFAVGEKVKTISYKLEHVGVDKGDVGEVVKLPEAYAYPYQVKFEGSRQPLNCWDADIESVEVEEDDE